MICIKHAMLRKKRVTLITILYLARAHTVDESEICIHLAHLLQPDSRNGWGPNFQNSHLKSLREYGGYSMGLVSLNSQTVHGMNKMNKNEHFCKSV